MPRHTHETGLLARALSPLAKLPAGVLCNQLAGFLRQVGEVGGAAAVAGLTGPTGWTVLAVAGLFGVSEAWQSAKEKRKARRLADQLDGLAKSQSTALQLLNDIADGEIGITLDGITQLELADRIIDGLASAGLATSKQVESLGKNIGIYLNTADLMLREILSRLGDQAPELPPPNNNFVEADIRPNLDFVGREQVLDELHKRLEAGSVAITHSVSGEGGIGKTQVAAKYALEHGADYDGRWWLAAPRNAISEKTAALAQTLDLPLPPGAPPEQIRQAVCKRLSQGRHLLILDNLERVEDLDGFALTEPSRVLVATRLKKLPSGRVHDFPLSVLERGESVELLRKHRKDLAGAGHEEGLSRVAEHLGDHSLAVALAASYLRKRPNVEPGELLERLQRADVGAREHLFDSLDPNEHTAGYRLSVYLSLTLHLPDFRDTPAMKLLGLAAFCHPDAIPLDVFFDASDEPPETVEAQLESLADVSIIRYGKTVSLHRLMQEAVRVEIGEPAQRDFLTALVNVLCKRFEGVSDYRKWAKQDFYAAHARTAAHHAERIGGGEGAGTLGNDLGRFLQKRARFTDALSTLRRAERIDRPAYGDEHPTVAIRVNNIGSVLQAQGDLDGALKCYREAEGIDRAAYGDEHPEVAADVNNIGSVLRAQGDLDGALKCFREAERIDRVAYGDEHPTVAIRVNNIGGVLLAQGDLDGARRMASDAYRVFLTTVGPRALETMTVAESLRFLGIDPLSLGREIAGKPVAEELRQALAERDSK